MGFRTIAVTVILALKRSIQFYGSTSVGALAAVALHKSFRVGLPPLAFVRALDDTGAVPLNTFGFTPDEPHVFASKIFTLLAAGQAHDKTGFFIHIPTLRQFDARFIGAGKALCACDFCLLCAIRREDVVSHWLAGFRAMGNCRGFERFFSHKIGSFRIWKEPEQAVIANKRTSLEGTDFEVMEWIQSGTVDTGFVTLPNETFDTTYIIQDEFRFLIPSGHGLAQCASIDISQVASEPFIMSLGGCELFIREFFAENDLSPNVKYKVRDMATLIAMVREGLGISIAPTLSLPPKIENFVALSFKKPVYRKLALATRGNQDKLPVVEEFIEKIRSWVSISQLSKS